MKMEKLKLAIIGCAGMPFDALYDCTKKLPMELCALCAEETDAEEFCSRYRVPAVYSDYKQMLKEQSPGLVWVFTAEDLLADITADCLRAGAYVYAERPICMSSQSAQRMIEVQKETGRYAVPRFNRRHMPGYLMAKEIVSRGEFGRPTMFFGKFQASDYAGDKKMLWWHVSHMVDTARFLLGEIRLLHVARSIFSPTKICYNISFTTPGGCIGLIQCGSTQCFEYPMERVEVAGEGCNVIVDNTRKVEYNRTAPHRVRNADMVLTRDTDTQVWNMNLAHVGHFTYTGLDGCMENLVDAALNGKKPDFDISDTLETIRLLEAIEQIAEDVR
jgi:predicted dehydrogenase